MPQKSKYNFGGNVFTSMRPIGPTIKQKTNLSKMITNTLRTYNNIITNQENESLKLARAHLNVHPNMDMSLFIECENTHKYISSILRQRVYDGFTLKNAFTRNNREMDFYE
jgi:hypothetical protein